MRISTTADQYAARTQTLLHDQRRMEACSACCMQCSVSTPLPTISRKQTVGRTTPLRQRAYGAQPQRAAWHFNHSSNSCNNRSTVRLRTPLRCAWCVVREAVGQLHTTAAHMTSQRLLTSSRVICFRSSPGLSTMPAHRWGAPACSPKCRLKHLRRGEPHSKGPQEPGWLARSRRPGGANSGLRPQAFTCTQLVSEPSCSQSGAVQHACELGTQTWQRQRLGGAVGRTWGASARLIQLLLRWLSPRPSPLPPVSALQVLLTRQRRLGLARCLCGSHGGHIYRWPELQGGSR